MRLSFPKALQVILALTFVLFLHVLFGSKDVKLEHSDTWMGKIARPLDPSRAEGDGERGGRGKRDLAAASAKESGHRKISSLETQVGDLDQEMRTGDNVAHSSSKLYFNDDTPAMKIKRHALREITRKTELKDIYISIKTTKKFHEERLRVLLETWVVLAKSETHFFTDSDDKLLESELPSGHLVNTNCSSVHNRKALCCKMAVEFDSFIASNKRWFCHADDDTYINVPALLKLLQSHNHTRDWYIGRPSLSHPLEIADPEDRNRRISFWFATGGAGFCISRGLALKMVPFAGGGRLRTVCDKIRLPDDCSIGYIISANLGKELTVVREFHSHLEGLFFLRGSMLERQITISYSKHGTSGGWNTVNVDGLPKDKDPTRFRSVHCALNPYLSSCLRR